MLHKSESTSSVLAAGFSSSDNFIMQSEYYYNYYYDYIINNNTPIGSTLGCSISNDNRKAPSLMRCPSTERAVCDIS